MEGNPNLFALNYLPEFAHFQCCPMRPKKIKTYDLFKKQFVPKSKPADQNSNEYLLKIKLGYELIYHYFIEENVIQPHLSPEKVHDETAYNEDFDKNFQYFPDFCANFATFIEFLCESCKMEKMKVQTLQALLTFRLNLIHAAPENVIEYLENVKARYPFFQFKYKIA